MKKYLGAQSAAFNLYLVTALSTLVSTVLDDTCHSPQSPDSPLFLSLKLETNYQLNNVHSPIFICNVRKMYNAKYCCG